MADSFSMPEFRGVNTTSERQEYDDPYSAMSYAAQYGITVEDAEEIVERSQYHGQAKRQITKMIASSPETRKRAMDLD